MSLTIRCSGIWTGSGPPTGPAGITIDDGRITGIDPKGGYASGPFVIPAFVDAHCHFSWTGLQAVTLDLSGVTSPGELLDILAVEARSLPTCTLLRAENMEETSWDVPDLPSLDELDSATGERPTFIRRVCGHAILVNRAMMELLPGDSPGLDRSTGVAREGIALRIDRLFPPDRDTLVRALKEAGRIALSAGVTAVCSMEPLFALKVLGENPPDVHLTAGIITDDPGELTDTIASGCWSLPTLLGLKVFLDGSIGVGTAALTAPYLDGSSVVPLLSGEELAGYIVEASGMGLATLVHAIGGRALGLLEGVCADLASTAPDSLAHGVRVEHAEELTGTMPGRWDPAVHSFCMQPNFVNRWQRGGGLYESMLGPEASIPLNPFATVLGNDFRLGFGSDGMPFGPLLGLAGATEHPDPAQRLDTGAALHAYTLGAADISGFRELSVPLCEGRLADLVLLSESPFTAGSWDSVEIIATMRAGETLFAEGEVRGARFGQDR